MTEITTERAPQLHIRYEGRSFDVDLTELDVGNLSTNEQVKLASATYLSRFLDTQIPESKLREFDIDRNQETGDLTVRPPAVFG